MDISRNPLSQTTQNFEIVALDSSCEGRGVSAQSIGGMHMVLIYRSQGVVSGCPRSSALASGLRPSNPNPLAVNGGSDPSTRGDSSLVLILLYRLFFDAKHDLNVAYARRGPIVVSP